MKKGGRVTYALIPRLGPACWRLPVSSPQRRRATWHRQRHRAAGARCRLFAGNVGRRWLARWRRAGGRQGRRRSLRHRAVTRGPGNMGVQQRHQRAGAVCGGLAAHAASASAAWPAEVAGKDGWCELHGNCGCIRMRCMGSLPQSPGRRHICQADERLVEPRSATAQKEGSTRWSHLQIYADASARTTSHLAFLKGLRSWLVRTAARAATRGSGTSALAVVACCFRCSAAA